jgi:tetratricopeptide (TPR) repeat protein
MHFKRKAYYFLIGFLCFISPYVSGQDQKVADSLVKIYREDTLENTAKLELLRNLSFNEVNDLKLALQYAEELINLSSQQGNNLYLYRGYLQKGNKKRLLGDLDEALAAYFKSGVVAGKANYLPGEGSAYSAIADIYSISNNHHNATLYYNKAIATLRLSDDSIALAAAISNAGDEFLNNKIYDSALLIDTIFLNEVPLNREVIALSDPEFFHCDLPRTQLAFIF